MPPLRPLVLSLALALTGCAQRTPAPPARPPLPPGEAPRIAVLPFRVGELTERATFIPPPEGRPTAEDAGVEVARTLAARLADAGARVVDADVVQGAASLADAGSYDARFASRVADKTGANLAVIGALSRWRQRRGTAWAAESPASVAYQVALVRASDGAVVAVDRFDYTQQALSENLLDLGKFVQAGGRWLTREEILEGGFHRTAERLAAAARGAAAPSGPSIRLPGTR